MSPRAEDPLAHRRFLPTAVDVRPFHGTSLFATIGGQRVVDRLVDGLYARIEADAALRPIFPADLTQERERQKVFFAQWFGGEPHYDRVGYSSLKHKHDAVPITRATAGRWLGHFRRALDETVASDAERETIFERLEAFAFALVNDDTPPPKETRKAGARGYMPEGSIRAATCGLGSPEHPRNRASELARRGDLAGLRELLKREPSTLKLPTHAAVVLQAAALAGELESVELLLARGVDANLPASMPGSSETVMFITPLCAARWKRRKSVTALLEEKGARTDMFTAAFLGDVSELAAELASHPELAQAPDPAGDILDVTPVHHAVTAGQLDALRVLLEHAERAIVGAARALGTAAAQQNVAMVKLLLEHGADATHLGAGGWVLHPELAPLLAAAGARVEPGGDWMRLSCTGNQGRKDNPEFVRALLRHGARVDDRRRQGVTATGATALHYVAKAGFLKTIQVLLEHGADPEARDDDGKTPLDWLAKASKSVDRDAVRRLLNRK